MKGNSGDDAVTAEALAAIIRPDGGGGVILPCRVIPRAPVDKIIAVHNGELKIALKAPPVDGKANAALEKFLSSALKIPRSCIKLVAGTTSRHKTVAITQLTPPQAVSALFR